MTILHFCLLQEHPVVRARTDEQVAAYRAQRQIHVYGEGVPKPCTTFEEASFPGEQQARICIRTGS
jgi:ATP-dependent RNA helicase DDX5/DBP2